MVELGRDGPRVPAGGKARPEGLEAAEGADLPRTHHRHRDKAVAPAPALAAAGEQDRVDARKAEGGEPGAREERTRPHRSRSKETPSERGRVPGPKGGRRHHLRGSPEEAAEREPRPPARTRPGQGRRRGRGQGQAASAPPRRPPGRPQGGRERGGAGAAAPGPAQGAAHARGCGEGGGGEGGRGRRPGQGEGAPEPPAQVRKCACGWWAEPLAETRLGRSRRAAQGAAAHRRSPHSRPQNSAKARSVWEQRVGQLRLQNLRASCEALYSEMDPEERLRCATTPHLRPDMKTHLDRQLVVELGRDGLRVPAGGKARPEGPEAAQGADPPRRHHRHRDKAAAPALAAAGEQDRVDAPKAEGEEPGAWEERTRLHRSRSKETRSERGRGPGSEGGRRHHRRGSPEEAAKREPRRHRAHRHALDQGKEGGAAGA
ncbi:PREDICTED: uncharacterized protein LOC101367640 [Odobenus rosmarus divergens]|uniref:Uncharacterized protein LOC101367640 n=1 Tax=Odobenus rosmarus divergens TaxID=9708 RepID=A0A9B0HES5_ODORO